MTPEEQAIRDRWARATGGPWRAADHFDGPILEGPVTEIDTEDGEVAVCAVYDDDGTADVEAIAHAPEDVAWLLAELDAYRQEVGRLCDEIGNYVDAARRASARPYDGTAPTILRG